MQFPDTARTCQEGNFLVEYVQIKVKTIIKRLNDVKRQTNYLVCNIEGTGTDVSFMRFNFPFGLELFAPCRQGLFFLRCFQKVDGYDRQSEGVVRITSNTLSPKGKEDFTQSVLNTEAIRKQRFTFASSKRMAQTAKVE